jgi:hypothetical protein
MPKQGYLTAAMVRNWLGLYVLILASVTGGWMLLAPTILLPLETHDRVAAFEIVIPFLLGQLAAVFRYYSNDSAAHHKLIELPTWVVQAPPIVVSILFGIEFFLLAVGGISPKLSITPSPESVRAVLTFGVALLNASTVFVITRYFENNRRGSSAVQEAKPTGEPAS